MVAGHTSQCWRHNGSSSHLWCPSRYRRCCTGISACPSPPAHKNHRCSQGTCDMCCRAGCEAAHNERSSACDRALARNPVNARGGLRTSASNSRSARWLRSGSGKRPTMLANQASEVPHPSNSCCTRSARARASLSKVACLLEQGRMPAFAVACVALFRPADSSSASA